MTYQNTCLYKWYSAQKRKDPIDESYYTVLMRLYKITLYTLNSINENSLSAGQKQSLEQQKQDLIDERNKETIRYNTYSEESFKDGKEGYYGNQVTMFENRVRGLYELGLSFESLP
jgi:hypothetical protein